jgi:L-rhamnose-H+ transport protein
MVSDVISFSFFIFAGIINGTFAVFTKYTPKWKFENIWLQFVIWSFFLVPWIFAIFLVPQIFEVYTRAPLNLIFIMISGGIVFGIGQVCFALALHMIGIGLSFVLNIGIGIALGSLLPLIFQHRERILTMESFLIFIAVILSIIGIVLSNYAGKIHHKMRRKMEGVEEKHHYVLGMFLAIIAGLASAGQNFSFSLTNQLQSLALKIGANQVGASIVMWPGFLTCSCIPYVIFMSFLFVKNKSFNLYFQKGIRKYYSYGVIMGVFWFGSLIFYSLGAAIVGKLGPVLGWPLFMVFIILASNFWGWREGEWHGCSKKTKHLMWSGLLFLIFSILLLAFVNFQIEG